MTKIHSTPPLPVTFIYAVAFLISTLQLNALSTDDTSYIFFSGSGATVTNSSDATETFTDISDDSSAAFIAGWEYGSIEGASGESYASYDSDTGEYEATLVYLTSGDNIFGMEVQQVEDTTPELEYTNEDDTKDTQWFDNSTLLDSLYDEILCSIYFKGSSASDVSEFSVNFYNASSTTNIFSYSINNGVTESITTDDESTYAGYQNEILDQLVDIYADLTEDSSDTSSDIHVAFFDVLEFKTTTDTTAYEELVEFVLLDYDDKLDYGTEVNDELNEIYVTVDDTQTLVYNLSIDDFTDYESTNTDSIAIMSFDFVGLDVTSVDNTTLLDTIFDAAQTYGTSDTDTEFTADTPTGDDLTSLMDSLVDLLNLSIDEEDDGADSQGVYTIAISTSSYDATISGTITDPGLVSAAATNYVLSNDNSVIIDQNSGWYGTWMGVVHFDNVNAAWGYSPVFGFFYGGVANFDSDLPWLYLDSIQNWIHTIEPNATDEGFWAFVPDTGNPADLNGWLFFVIEASDADPDNWFIYEFNTDTFHTFGDL
ncbi:hypothetical protein [Rubellicoccus peritrichatus]|uniref:Uncharacterized protein n=1 Tax=Rubellicoccus peritrichatus TaxID=3080537 RepID=A0AAQ3L9D3_9BACT|nr:hypothetical protein [Puniceicoccus sp. CR14]WOO41246.1 hypothetical protein RZN69_21710 [Puniceicoccus sp. CR14]